MTKGLWLFILYLAVGVYLLNMQMTPFSFFAMPDFFEDVNKWVVLAASVLLILNSFKFLRKKPAE
ncbi:MAG: hypothetical protein ABEI74_01770 [Candidatus Pacearchaeota archaeon]